MVVAPMPARNHRFKHGPLEHDGRLRYARTMVAAPDTTASHPSAVAGEFQRLELFLKHVAKGTVIFEQGDAGSTMFFIQEGRVRITKVAHTRQQPIAVLEAGSFFGEMAVVTGEPRSARAEAISDCVLLEIDQHTLDEFLATQPQVARRMIQTLARRLRDTDELIERLLDGDPMLQVVATLLELTEATLPDQVAQIDDVQTLMVRSATDPALLRWVLGRLKRAHFIAIDGRRIRVVQRERLLTYLNFLRMQQDMLNPSSRR